ncbi:hypothetical protein [Pseudomonas putida]|uniref:hypothetical protein n=1 Tax=Pseudomonas putida TaxID=303 RepID=UPI003D962171
MKDTPDLPPNLNQQEDQTPDCASDCDLVESLRMPEDNIDFQPPRAIIIRRPLQD